MQKSKTPVTILSGTLGAGKTTTVNHLLENAGGREIAVLVNDMGEVNVDADLLSGGTDLTTGGEVAELSNGCICCELQDDLETVVRRLAQERNFDSLVVESSGISEPAPVAQLFATDSAVAALYDVDSLVSIIDTPRTLETFGEAAEIERVTEPGESERPLSDLLVEQIECSNVVVLNKCDLLDEAKIERVEALVQGLQPSAAVIRTTFGTVGPDELLAADRFDIQELRELPGWQQALDTERGDSGHDHRHPDDVYGISSFVYRTRQPFHPSQIRELLGDLPDEIVRAKGTLWIAGRDGLKLTYHKAGPSARIEAQGQWIASLPDAQQELYRSNHDLEWDAEHGDRRTELVFIGTDVDEPALRGALDDCLVDDHNQVGRTAADPLPDDPDGAVVLGE